MSDRETGSERRLDDQTQAALDLSLVPGIGPRLAQRLIAEFGSADAIWQQPPRRWQEVPGIGAEIAGAMAATRAQRPSERTWARCQDESVDVVASTSTGYPPPLLQIDDPPTVLYLRGQLLPLDSLAVAIVGTRHASPYGLRQAASLSASLARVGLTLVSGLARGIDARVHQTALNVGGRTVAVLASGLRDVYPAEHQSLANRIVESGCVLSEMGLDHRPRRGCFPRRNRLISGLSLGVIVVEATSHSGALITARHAMEQGRDVFAVPGPVDVRNSRGCHQLLRDGAKLVETVDDVLDELGPFISPLPTATDGTIRHAAELRLNPLEQQVLHAVDDSETSVDQLVGRCQMPVQRILATLSVLETRRLIVRVAGDRVRRRFGP